MRLRSLVWFCLSALALSSALANASPTASPTGAPSSKIGGRLNLALLGNPTNLVPFLAAEQNALTITGLIYQSLLTYDRSLNLVPQLAERYTISPDHRTITFTLKPKLVFSDGTPLTSADVSASFHAITDARTRTPYAGDYHMVQRFETPDSRTIKVTYATPFAPALSSWASLPVLPAKIVLETLTSDPSNTEGFNATRLKTQPLGSGPYVLTRWVRGQSLLLTRNPRSTEAPNITELFYRILPDQNSQWLEFKAGNLDMLDLTPLAATRLISDTWFTQNYKTYSTLSNSYTYLGFNLKNPLFADARVRQALSHAVNRQGLINAVLFGQGQPMTGLFKPGTWAHNASLTVPTFNPALAKQLLAQAGWKDADGDGVLEKNGQPFRFTLATNQGNDSRLKTAQVLQSLFADVGVQMDIRVQEWATFLTNTLQPRAFAAVLMGWGLGAEPDPYDIWHSSKTAPAEFNIVSFNNPQADALMTEARTTFNQAQRKQALDALQALIAAEAPYLWLYAPFSNVAVTQRLQGLNPGPAGLGWNLPQWWLN